MHGRGEPLLTRAELADRADFMLGSAILSPSTRTVTGPGGSAQVEPRVMQVLIVLADSVGAVVTRETLFARCWGGVYVGDDSLNRAIYGIRRIASGVAAGSFEVETVQGTGYRLTGMVSNLPVEQAGAAWPGPSRRLVIGGTLAAAIGGFGLWSALRPRTDARTEQLIEQAQRILYSELPDGGRTAAGVLEERFGAIRQMLVPGGCSPSPIAIWRRARLRKMSRPRSRRAGGQGVGRLRSTPRKAMRLPPRP